MKYRDMEWEGHHFEGHQGHQIKGHDIGWGTWSRGTSGASIWGMYVTVCRLPLLKYRDMDWKGCEFKGHQM